jgi:hypothetical protein
VRRDLLLRHDRTVHGKDGGERLHSDVKRRRTSPPKTTIAIDSSALEQIEASSDGIVDLETAAMLMTDFHHKATAAVRDGNGARSVSTNGGHTPVASAPGASMPVSTRQSPILWNYSESETIARDSGRLDPRSHDTLAVLASAGTAQRRHHRMSSTVESSAVNGLVPALQAMIDSLPQSATATPGSRSPVQQRPPRPLSDQGGAPKISCDEERSIILEEIRKHDVENTISAGFRLPSIKSLNRYLSTYFGLFHHHLPFLHLASFSPVSVKPSLLLAVLSIGALYAFDHDQAFILHIGAKNLVSQFLQNKENFSSRKCPLWTMQSSLLNMIFASWSGDAKGLEWAVSIKSLLANMVAGNNYQLRQRSIARRGKPPTPTEWVEDESCRRTYFAVYIFFGLLTMTYNHTPAISFDEIEDLALPSTEAQWNASVKDGVTWNAPVPILTVVTAHDKLLRGETVAYSPFATRVMISALFLEIWYHKRSSEALQDIVTERKLRLALETWESSLSRCIPDPIEVPLSAPHAGHPLTFNAQAMFRNARVRLEIDLKAVQEAMRYHDSYEVAAAMSNSSAQIERSPRMTRIMQDCFECIETVALQGIRWVARTSATNWSVEHPLCGLDLMLVLSLWLYRLEQDEGSLSFEESAMYKKVKNLFDDDSAAKYDSNLSSMLARVWGGMLDEVVVWG